MEEVLSSSELALVKGTAEVDVLDGLALLSCILLLPLWIVSIVMDIEFHEHTEPRAGGRADEEVRIFLFNSYPGCPSMITSGEIPPL